MITLEERPAVRRVLYWDTLSSIAALDDQEILLFLKKIVTRFSRNLETLPFRQVEFSMADAFDAMRLMAKTGRVMYQKKPLLCDWQTEAQVFWHGDDTDRFSAFIRYKELEIPLESCDHLFPNWCIHKDLSFPIRTSVPWKWVEVFREGTVFLEGVRKKRFLEEDPPILWKESTPRLLLSDPNGCFANLSKAHSAWEMDLLEAGYAKKTVGNTQYFISLRQVASALLLLIDVGWEIVLPDGKRLYRQTGSEWKVSSEKEKISVRGTALFGNKKAPLKPGKLWVELDGSSAGLLDPEKGEPLEGEYVADQLQLQKADAAVLTSLLDRAEVDWEKAILETVRGLKEGAVHETLLPDPSFCGTLLPHQQMGVDWLAFLHKRGFSGLLADEMGLGKTVQVLAFFSRIRTNLPILIIAPSSLLFHWQSEIQKFLPNARVRIYSGGVRSSQDLLSQYVITSYALLRLDGSILSAIEWEAIVLDESGAIKTAGTQTAKAAYQLKARFKIALNGTPVENRQEELASQFQFLMPGLIQNIQTDARKVQPFLLRRKKDQLDLPEKIEQVVWVEMEEAQANLYRSYCEGIRSGLLKKIALDGISACRMEILEAILRLRQIASDPRLVGSEVVGSKIERLLADVEEAMQEKRKVLIYSQFSSMLSLIAKELKYPFLYLDGSVPLAERAQCVRRFQEDPDMPLFLLTLKAGGVGLNLTAADYVLLFDPWWNEAVENQAIDRAHRIGRKSTVIAKRYLAVGSIEEKMLDLKGEKRNLANALLDNGESFDWTEESLLHLFSPFF